MGSAKDVRLQENFRILRDFKPENGLLTTLFETSFQRGAAAPDYATRTSRNILLIKVFLNMEAGLHRTRKSQGL
jgi:hypothetical protein